MAQDSDTQLHANGHAPTSTSTSSKHDAATSTSLQALRSDLRMRVLSFLDEDSSDESIKKTQQQVKISLGVIEEALTRYRPSELSLSYNGGKDCLVLLILILACCAPSITPPKDADSTATATDSTSHHTQRLQAIYIAPTDPFTQVEDFVTTSTEEYHLDLLRYSLPMREALEAYLNDKPEVKAIFMGTRRTDPFCEFLEHFSPTDQGWPQFMRVNPMIDWCYVDIWNFIRRIGMPYCELYDQGYTSLGGTSNTVPNPVLAIDAEQTKFRPAYELRKDEEERLGRQRKKH